jgi:hypothetical protein
MHYACRLDPWQLHCAAGEFDAGEMLALIERERCSIYYGMPNMARALLEHPDHPKRHLSAMRTGLTIDPPEGIAMTIKALGAAELCNVTSYCHAPIGGAAQYRRQGLVRPPAPRSAASDRRARRSDPR